MPAIESLLTQRKQFLRFLQHRVEDPATAEDILQSAYMRAMQQAASLQEEESAVAWFYRILRNAVIDHYRHRAAQDRLLEGWANELLSQPDSIPELATAQIVCECLGEAIQNLHPNYSEILNAVDLKEAELGTFATDAGITTANAAVRLHRARHALRKSLTAICGACSKHGCIDCTCSDTSREESTAR